MRVAVIGAGVIGLATTAALLQRGVDVACFERLTSMAERSAGESRIFRLAHRDAELVDLAAQAKRLFTGWQEQANEELIDPVGVVVSGEDTSLWSEAMTAADTDHRQVGPDSELLHLPTRKIPSESVIDPAGGVLQVTRIGAFLTTRCQAVIRNEHVYALEENADGVLVRGSRRARHITTTYVQNTLDDVDPEVIDQLYCTVIPDLGDGVQFLRNGRVLAVYGENLFKLSPVIGHHLADAAVDGSLPAPMGAPQ